MSERRYSSSELDPIVLCIDDDPDVSETIALRLQHRGAKVLRAFHGMHGLQLAMTQRPSLIITDLRMPQGEGSYVIERLRNHPDTRSVPIIILTGQRRIDLAHTARRFHVDQVLTKPIHFDNLAMAIARFVPLREIRAKTNRLRATRSQQNDSMHHETGTNV